MHKQPGERDLRRCGVLALCDSCEQVDVASVGSACVGIEAGDRVAEVVAFERRALVNLPGEEAFAEWTEGDEADPELLERVAERKGATPAQVALAWVLAQKPWIVPIPGTTKLHRLEENIAATGVELTPGDLREIENAQIEAKGDRYSEANQRMIDR